MIQLNIPGYHYLALFTIRGDHFTDFESHIKALINSKQSELPSWALQRQKEGSFLHLLISLTAHIGKKN
jgi:hypothetical protein